MAAAVFVAFFVAARVAVVALVVRGGAAALVVAFVGFAGAMVADASGLTWERYQPS